MMIMDEWDDELNYVYRGEIKQIPLLCRLTGEESELL